MIHSIYGGSNSSIWVNCNAAPDMAQGMPFYSVDYDDIDDDKPAALGNAAHSLSEFCFRLNVTAYDCIDFTFNKSKDFPAGFVVDDNMAEAVQLYVGFIRDLAKKLGVEPLIEQRVYMISVRNDVFGTSDCIFIYGDTIWVIDYKHGYVSVNIKNNYQFIFYVIAALDSFGLWDKIKNIKTTVVQPRADHIDGAIRHCDYTMPQIRAYQDQIRRSVLNPNRTPTPGNHCKYCPASGHCRPRIMRSLQLAYHDVPDHKLSIQEVEVIYREIDVIKKNLEKIEKRMLNHARSGNNIEGYKLVPALKHYVCTDEKGFVDAAVTDGVDKNKLYQSKLLSKSRIGKLVKPEILDQFFIKPNSASTLVKMHDSRPALGKGSAAGIFKEIV